MDLCDKSCSQSGQPGHLVWQNLKGLTLQTKNVVIHAMLIGTNEFYSFRLFSVALT